ncbi:MAG TPA: HTTM domain-containing protein [bacterium]|nr:HTTM domain-containing protein [bacterium]
MNLRRAADPRPLAAFRILFGTLMLWDVVTYWRLYVPYFALPHLHFPYVPFIRPWPAGDGIRLHFIVMGVAAAFLALGFLYRISASVFFLAFAHFFLMDKFLYNNHYYLYALLAFLLIFVDAHRVWSLDALFRPAIAKRPVPFWNVALLRAQIVIVYFFGGLAKLNADWLAGEPMRHWLARKSDFWLIGPSLTKPWAPWFFSYGGLLFDLSIGFLLLWKKTRRPAVVVLVFFHLMNQWFFDIGLFPYVMIAATVLFFGNDAAPPSSAKTPKPAIGRATVALISVYLILQILIPLRHWLYPGDPAWTEEGQSFAWRMMLRDKTGKIRVTVTNPGTGESEEVDLTDVLTPQQLKMLTGRPDLIWQYAQFLKKRLAGLKIENLEIRAEATVSLNFREPQLLIDPSVDLAKVDYPVFRHADWIVPLVR